MQKSPPMKELNESFLNYCYYSICFGEFVKKSEETNNRIKDKRENPDFYKIFSNENKPSSNLYKSQIEVLNDNPNDNMDEKIRKIKEKINKVKSVIGINFEEMENMDEEQILYLLKNYVIDKIKNIFLKDFNLMHLLAVYTNDYCISSFGLNYKIIKLMKKNEDQNCGDLSVKYLFEQDNLNKEINSLKNKMKSMEKENKKKSKEMEKKLNEQQEEIKKNKDEFQKMMEEKDKNFQAIMEELKEKKEKSEEMEKKLNEQQEEIKKNKDEFQQIMEELKELKKKFDNEIKEKDSWKKELAKKDIKIESLENLTFDMIKAELNTDRLSKGFPTKNSHNDLISFLRKQESEIISLYSYLKYRGILDGYQELKK